MSRCHICGVYRQKHQERAAGLQVHFLWLSLLHIEDIQSLPVCGRPLAHITRSQRKEKRVCLVQMMFLCLIVTSLRALYSFKCGRCKSRSKNCKPSQFTRSLSIPVFCFLHRCSRRSDEEKCSPEILSISPFNYSSNLV